MKSMTQIQNNDEQRTRNPNFLVDFARKSDFGQFRFFSRMRKSQCFQRFTFLVIGFIVFEKIEVFSIAEFKCASFPYSLLPK
jgi:hypothetical protein